MTAAALAQTWLVVLTGLGGSPAHRAAFESQATAVVAGARARGQVPDSQIVRLGEGTTPRGDVAALTRTLRSLAVRAPANAVVVVILIGHGSALGGTPRFHLPGPDLTPEDLGSALAAFATQELVVINAASASGPWVAPLAGPRRTIITATRSDTERFETRFAQHLAGAFAGDTADADRNGRLSVLELFEYARTGVERQYQAERRMRTEHALLDDDGDGRGSLIARADSGDGRRAALLWLTGTPAGASGDPVLAGLVARRDSLERALAALRGRRATLDSAAYERELERLLLRAAETGREIRAREARP